MGLKLLVCLCMVTLSVAHPPLQFEYERGFKGIKSPHLRPQEYLLQDIGPKFRLNETMIPSHYDVELLVILDDDEPDIGAYLTAPGKVTIGVVPAGDTDVVTLHARLLNVNYESIKVTNVRSPDEAIAVTSHTNDTESGRHFLTLQLDKVLVQGAEYQIYVEFVAPISTNERSGLYLSTYVDPVTGEERRHAVTQMESVGLRQLFPAFDEPNLKATFDVTVISKDKYNVRANALVQQESQDPTRPGWTVHKFLRTVPMSTYLFALVVSDFTYSEAPLDAFGGKPVRVYGPPHLIARGGGEYSATLAANLLQFYNEYFLAEYPLDKMDSVAAPNFSGAMENYGLNIYTLSALLYYPDESLETNRDSITSIVAHELAHQNFGDLVTCKWWTNIWLNEGFATYVSFLGVDHVKPEFRAQEQILIDAVQPALVYDAGPNTHPILNDALTPSEIDLYFSTITYQKGGSVNRMTENFLTQDTYQKGLQYYLAEMKFKGAEQDDLFRNLDKAAAEDNVLPVGVTVKQILDSWTLKSGFPLVRVSVASVSAIYVSQEKFVNNGQPAQSSLWFVPITLVTAAKPVLPNHVPEYWLPDNVALSLIQNVDTSQFAMINQDATGFYRVLYDAALTSRIKTQLDSNATVITPLSRAQLLDDYFTFGFEGYLPISSAISLTSYLEQEDHFTVWDTVFKHLRRVLNLQGGVPSDYAVLQKYLAPRVEAVLLKLGVEQDNDKHIGAVGIERMSVLDWACALDHPACAEYAAKLLTQWRADPGTNPVHQDIQSMIFCAMVANGDASDYAFIYEAYQITSTDFPVKPRLLNALGCATDPTLLSSLLADAINPESKLQRSDATTAMQRVAMNTAGRDLVLEFLDSKLAEVISVIGNGSVNPVGSVINTLSSYSGSEADLIKIQAFIDKNTESLAPISENLNNYLNTLRSNIAWVDLFGSEIIKSMNL